MRVSLECGERVALRVCDSGARGARRDRRRPCCARRCSSRGGLGIGLYQAARQAEASGYRARAGEQPRRRGVLRADGPRLGQHAGRRSASSRARRPAPPPSGRRRASLACRRACAARSARVAVGVLRLVRAVFAVSAPFLPVEKTTNTAVCVLTTRAAHAALRADVEVVRPAAHAVRLEVRHRGEMRQRGGAGAAGDGGGHRVADAVVPGIHAVAVGVDVLKADGLGRQEAVVGVGADAAGRRLPAGGRPARPGRAAGGSRSRRRAPRPRRRSGGAWSRRSCAARSAH